MMKNFADVINCEIFSFLSENPEQYSARSRIKGQNTIPIAGPPRGEVSIIKEIVNGCISMGINSIMVTTPYKQQERMLQLHLPLQESGGIRVGTIDKFQGQEDEVTIISMVRSNNKMYHQEAIGGHKNIPIICFTM
jgi:AAA domain